MKWKCSGCLPTLASKPKERRLFAFCGRSLAEGVLLIHTPSGTDKYRIEWDAVEACWLVCKDDPDAEIYAVRPERCNCFGSLRWGHCRHREVFFQLVQKWWLERKSKEVVDKPESECILEVSGEPQEG